MKEVGPGGAPGQPQELGLQRPAHGKHVGEVVIHAAAQPDIETADGDVADARNAFRATPELGKATTEHGVGLEVAERNAPAESRFSDQRSIVGKVREAKAGADREKEQAKPRARREIGAERGGLVTGRNERAALRDAR